MATESRWRVREPEPSVRRAVSSQGGMVSDACKEERGVTDEGKRDAKSEALRDETTVASISNSSLKCEDRFEQ